MVIMFYHWITPNVPEKVISTDYRDSKHTIEQDGNKNFSDNKGHRTGVS